MIGQGLTPLRPLGIGDFQWASMRMDNLHNRLTFDLGKKNKIFYYEIFYFYDDPKISRIT